jgi:hypothetical protein
MATSVRCACAVHNVVRAVFSPLKRKKLATETEDVVIAIDAHRSEHKPEPRQCRWSSPPFCQESSGSYALHHSQDSTKGGFTLGPDPIWVPTQLISTIGPPFCKVWVHNWVSKYKALAPKWRPNLNGRNELEAIRPMLRNWATSNLDPIPLSQPKGLAPFLYHVGCHVGWGKAWVGPWCKALGPDLENSSYSIGPNWRSLNWVHNRASM